MNFLKHLPPPPPLKPRSIGAFMVRLPPEIAEWVEKIAAENRVSGNQIVIAVLKDAYYEAVEAPKELKPVIVCAHEKTRVWEPHLAGARKCLDCGKVYNPNRTPAWQLESSE